jgi:hypothetical protein
MRFFPNLFNIRRFQIMSVNPCSLFDFAAFAALSLREKLTPSLTEACQLAERLSRGNARAYQHQYDEAHEVYRADEIEAEALKLLADTSGTAFDRYYGGLSYNCFANDGTGYLGEDEIFPYEELDAETRAIYRAVDDCGGTLAFVYAPDAESITRLMFRLNGKLGYEIRDKDLYKILMIRLENPLYAVSVWEKKIREKLEGDRRARERKAEDDRAYAVVGPEAVLSYAEILEKAKAVKADRIIFAEFHVCESDPYTDYYGGRSSRRIVIGFGKGKKESFPQLRKAASLFPATAHLGMGKGLFSAYTVWDHDSTDESAKAASCYCTDEPYYKGKSTIFGNKCPTFETIAELQEWIEANPLRPGIVYESTSLEDGLRAIENRENYSMGGGNYLGRSRYSGWQVYSYGISYQSSGENMEFYESTREDLERVKEHEATKPKPAAKPKAVWPQWDDRGYLSEEDNGKGYLYTRYYRSESLLAETVAKLEGLGYGVQVKRCYGKRYAIQKTSDPAPVQSEPQPASIEIEEAPTLYDWLGAPIAS